MADGSFTLQPRLGRRPPRGVEHIIEIHGSQDGIRFGLIRVGNRNRAFFHDRISGVVRLYTYEVGGARRQEVDDVAMTATAKGILDAAWALEREAFSTGDVETWGQPHARPGTTDNPEPNASIVPA